MTTWINGGGIGGAGVGPAFLPGGGIPETMPNIATDFSRWETWLLANKIAGYESHCPQGRSTTYYFSQAGNDSTGDGSESNPWQSRSKAITESAAGGGIRLRFRGGDTWRDRADWVITNDNITVDSYGTGKATFSAFTESYSGGWMLASGNRWTRVEADAIAWIVEDGVELTDPFIRVSSTAEVESTARSFYWDSATMMLHINDGGNPNGNAYYGLIDGANNGIEFRGDGCRAENLIALGYGMTRDGAATQAQPFTNRNSGENTNLFKACEGYYSDSHVMAHNQNSGSGGNSCWLNCKAGFATTNGSGETIFNTYSSNGGQETLFVGCEVTYGTLKSSDWNYAQNGVRGTGFFGHTNGSGNIGLVVVSDCTLENSHSPASRLGGMSNTPSFDLNKFEDCRCFFVDCLQELSNSGTNGNEAELTVANKAVIYGCKIYALRNNRNPLAFTNIKPVDCYFINCYIELDCQEMGDNQNGLYNANSGGSKPIFYHTAIKLINASINNTRKWGINYDNRGSATAVTTSEATAFNSVLSMTRISGNGDCFWALNNQAEFMKNNAGFDVSDDPGFSKGYDNDAGYVDMVSAYDLANPPAELANAGTTEIQLSHDINGNARTGTPDIGPVAI